LQFESKAGPNLLQARLHHSACLSNGSSSTTIVGSLLLKDVTVVPALTTTSTTVGLGVQPQIILTVQHCQHCLDE
jgi:hypothetical protein